MMRVRPAPEPDAFDEEVRQPGRRALDRLAVQNYSGSKEAIPASEFPPYWRESVDDLLAAYNRICSYLCLYIPRATGARSVDHMVPKSLAWNRAYPASVTDLPFRVAVLVNGADRVDVAVGTAPIAAVDGGSAGLQHDISYFGYIDGR